MWEKSKHGAVDIVSGTEPLTTANSEGLRRMLDECLNDGQPRLVFDAAQVPLIDSAGLEVLLDVRDAARNRGGQFHLASLNSLCADILQATGLADRFELHDDAVAAAGSFAQ